jgi:hypothetical protein
VSSRQHLETTLEAQLLTSSQGMVPTQAGGARSARTAEVEAEMPAPAEVEIAAPAPTLAPAPNKVVAPKTGAASVVTGVPISRPDKVMWPPAAGVATNPSAHG